MFQRAVGDIGLRQLGGGNRLDPAVITSTLESEFSKS
jgi:hypothetical protein